MTLGEKLAKLRKENNYTQEQLAGVLGVSRQAISKWESDTAYPETDKLIRISELFGCSLDYLLKDKADMTCENRENKSAEDALTHLQQIFIQSQNLKNLVSCFKVTVSPVLKPAKNQPQYLLLGVDKVTIFGEHTTQLGWYTTEEAVQKEITEISDAINRKETIYTLKYDVAVNSTGTLKDIKTKTPNDSHVKKKIMVAIAIILLLIFIGAIYSRWNDLFYEFGQNIYRWLH